MHVINFHGYCRSWSSALSYAASMCFAAAEELASDAASSKWGDAAGAAQCQCHWFRMRTLRGFKLDLESLLIVTVHCMRALSPVQGSLALAPSASGMACGCACHGSCQWCGAARAQPALSSYKLYCMYGCSTGMQQYYYLILC